MADASVQIASQYDDDFVYLAARVRDDSVEVAENTEKRKAGDFMEIFISPISRNNQTTGPASSDITEIRVVAAPSDDPTSGIIQIRGQQHLQAACVSTSDGYQMELAVPADLWNEAQGEAWTSFAVNIKINDRETIGSKQAELWWKPEWNRDTVNPENGRFLRK